MTTERRRAAMTAFETRDDADRALTDLRNAGYSDEHVGWAMRGEEAPEGTTDVSDEVAKDAAAGAVTGGVLGGLGAAAAMALIPGVGPFIAGGALATTLITAGASAAAGGVLGGLIGLGASNDEAKFYEDEFKAGRPIMTVDAGDRNDEATEIFRRNRGYDYASRQTTTGQGQSAPTMTRSTTADVVEREVTTQSDATPSGGTTTTYETVRTTTER